MPHCSVCKVNRNEEVEAYCSLVFPIADGTPATIVPLCDLHEDQMVWELPSVHCEMIFKLPLTCRSSPVDWEWDLEVIFPPQT